MKYFRKVEFKWLDSEAINHLKYEATREEYLWYVNLERQKYHTLSETQSIVIRGPDRTTGIKDINSNYLFGTCPTELANHFPYTTMIVNRIAQEFGDVTSRIAYARLKPNGKVYPHKDGNETPGVVYYNWHHRYHLSVVNPVGVPFRCDDEEIIMHEGECWRFDNTKLHSTTNPSNDVWRIHLIFDLFPLSEMTLPSGV